MKKYLCLIIVLMLALAPGCAEKDNSKFQNEERKSTSATSDQNEKAGKPVKKYSQKSDNDNKTSENAEKPSYKETGKVIKEADKDTNTETNQEEKGKQIHIEETKGEIKKINMESLKGITPKEAEDLCYEAMGEKDEETGFIYGFSVTGAVEKDGKQYYTIRASWLVDNSHMSYIGDLFVSADGKEVYDGVVYGDEYEISKLIWSK